jgi:dTMP kinase
MFISFEGLDFSGKSTQVGLLSSELQRRHVRVLVLREPGGTAIGELMRAQLLDRKNSGLTEAGELFLFSASRSQLVQEVIRPALENRTVVICDRYVDSTTAYQGYGRQIPLDHIAAVNRLATAGLVPDKTYYLDIPLDEIERRAVARAATRDRMESNGPEFFARVREGFLALAKADSRFMVLNGMDPVEALHHRIIEDIQNMRSFLERER